MQIKNLIDKKLLFVSGKGGVGKTFTAVWIAMYAVNQGKRVLLVESGSLSQLECYFNQEISLNEVVQISDGLSALHIDFEGCLRDYLKLRLKNQSIRNAFITNKRMRSFLDAIPGLPEVMMLGRLYYSAAREKDYDLIIYDSPASGHFLNLMTTLDAMIAAGFTGPLIHQVNTIINYLSKQEECGAVLVTNPEELVINETFDFLPKLQELSRVKIDGLIVNRCFENTMDGSLEEALGLKLHQFINSKIGRSQMHQKQIDDQLSPFNIPVLLKFRELGNMDFDTFFQEAWINPSAEIQDES